jgi:hypothetical protein
VELALAAIAGGADAIKVHLNVEHRASGTRFGSFAEESHRLRAITAAAKGTVSLGIMPGADTVASCDELEALADMGFEFLDCYAFNLPADRLADRRLKKMIACGPSYRVDEVRCFAELGVDALEASIVEPEGYGRPLMFDDLARYRSLVEASRLPVIVPTQRRISPTELDLMGRAGVSGIMIGAIVTGKEPEIVEKSTSRFREGIKRMLESRSR